MVEWLTAREVAEIFGVSPDTVCRWVTKGKLQPIGKTRSSYVFDPRYIALEAEKRRKAAQAA